MAAAWAASSPAVEICGCHLCLRFVELCASVSVLAARDECAPRVIPRLGCTEQVPPRAAAQGQRREAGAGRAHGTHRGDAALPHPTRRIAGHASSVNQTPPPSPAPCQCLRAACHASYCVGLASRGRRARCIPNRSAAPATPSQQRPTYGMRARDCSRPHGMAASPRLSAGWGRSVPVIFCVCS